MRKIIETQNLKGFSHTLAIAEEQYAPELSDYYGDIAFINSAIRNENVKNDIYPFKLWKTQVKGMKNESTPIVQNNRWREWQRNGRPGYHIGYGRATRKFAQFIRRYFKNWEVPQSA